MKGLAAAALSVLLAACVTVAPAPGMGAGPVVAPNVPNYFTVHAELMSKFPNEAAVVPSGLSVDWGGFQSRYVAAGTSIGIARDDPDLPGGVSLLLGGGPQFHVPLGNKALLIPALNFAYRINNSGFFFDGYLSLGAAYRFDPKMYAGIEAETPLLLQETTGLVFFPGALNMKAMFGVYY